MDNKSSSAFEISALLNHKDESKRQQGNEESNQDKIKNVLNVGVHVHFINFVRQR